MAIDQQRYFQIRDELQSKNATLIAVSKTKPVEDIKELYDLGHRDFGENYVQELVQKQPLLPDDIRWHFIGHLQSNKVKYIAPFVHLIHSIDSYRLLKEVDKQGQKLARTIPVLLQIHIAKEETKFGLDEGELMTIMDNDSELTTLSHVKISGLMGMASFSSDHSIVKNEFQSLKKNYDRYADVHTANVDFQWLSMGMSGDYPLALEEGSNLVRIGSLLFGKR